MKTTYFCGFFTFFRHWTTLSFTLRAKSRKMQLIGITIGLNSENETFCSFKYQKNEAEQHKKDGPQNILCPAAC